MAKRPDRVGPWYRVGICILKPPSMLFTRPDWHGAEHVPRAGGVLLAVNHISHADPVVVADYVLYGLRRAPRFLAKAQMFRGDGLVGRVMRGADQIPVYRETHDASAALAAAVDALHRGACVVIYPEGTVTRDPLKWPMTARTGVARLALLSGAPVVPVAQWGAQEVHDSSRGRGVHLWPPKQIRMLAGPPVDLSAFHGLDLSAEVLRGATDAVMDAVTRQLEVLRGEPAPAQRDDGRATVRATTINDGGTDGRRTA